MDTGVDTKHSAASVPAVTALPSALRVTHPQLIGGGGTKEVSAAKGPLGNGGIPGARPSGLRGLNTSRITSALKPNANGQQSTVAASQQASSVAAAQAPVSSAAEYPKDSTEPGQATAGSAGVSAQPVITQIQLLELLQTLQQTRQNSTSEHKSTTAEQPAPNLGGTPLKVGQSTTQQVQLNDLLQSLLQQQRSAQTSITPGGLNLSKKRRVGWRTGEVASDAYRTVGDDLGGGGVARMGVGDRTGGGDDEEPDDLEDDDDFDDGDSAAGDDAIDDLHRKLDVLAGGIVKVEGHLVGLTKGFNDLIAALASKMRTM